MTIILVTIAAGCAVSLAVGHWVGYSRGESKGKAEAAGFGLRDAAAVLAERSAGVTELLDRMRSAQGEDAAVLVQRFENMEKAMQARSEERFTSATRALSESIQERIAESDRARGEDRRQLQGAVVQPVIDQIQRVVTLAEGSHRGASESSAQIMEAARKIGEQVSQVSDASTTLSQALKGDRAERGRWGEIQLERLVEMAGLNEKVDWSRQEGGDLRPDLVLHLPGADGEPAGIPVDAKAPMDAFLRMTETEDPDVQGRLRQEHSKALRNHVDALGRRNYGGSMQGPGFTILFLPLDALLSEAIRVGGDQVLQRAAEKRIVLATPHTLLAMMWAVAATWRQSALQENAEIIRKEAVELHNRFGVFWSKFGTIGKAIARLVDAHNGSVASAEARLMPSLRRFREMQGLDPAHGDPGPEPEQVEAVPRVPELPDMTGDA